MLNHFFTIRLKGFGINEMKSFFCIAIVIALVLLVNTAHSAQIRLKGENNNVVSVEFIGEIQSSDADALKRLIEPYLSSTNVFRTINLNSQGGDVATAMKIGRYLRRLEFDTRVNANALCLSSCVFILASGRDRGVLATNIVGIHRPFGMATGLISREDATKKYRDLTAQIYAYFNEMNMPRSLPEEMLRIPPEEMKMLTIDEAMQFGLFGKDPVAQEQDDSFMAKKFGISRQEYLVRRPRALKECDLPPPNYLDNNCYNAILMGKR